MTSLIDVDVLIDAFITEYAQGIATLHRIFFKSNNQLSLTALKEEVKDELRTGCVYLINKGKSFDSNDKKAELNSYLFYIVNAFCKKTAIPVVKKVAEYVCPGCVFLGKTASALSSGKMLRCHECTDELQNTIDPQKLLFFKTFSYHAKNGYRCEECERFIPRPIDNVKEISCPYFDCFWAGQLSALENMRHPTTKTNPEKIILDDTLLKTKLVSHDNDALYQLEIAQDLQDKIDKIHSVIESQTNNILYSSSGFTVPHKQFVYEAFGNLLKRHPKEMVEYLFNTSNSHMGFQHKVFQEYIRLLEKAMPISYIKNKKQYKVSSLLDVNLNLFDGISVFDGIVDEKLSIKNGTTEFYIGGRKGAYAKPYYIGKLLNVMQSDGRVNVTHLVTEYTFSKIRLSGVAPGTAVTVTHLRVPPHYQLGGMVHVNRIRKKIVERLKSTTKTLKS